MKPLKPILVYGIIALLSATFACVNKSETFETGSDYNYFPLKKGKYIIYDVDSVTYDLLSQSAHTVAIDTTVFQVKELVADTLSDAQGRPSFKIEYYTRKDSSQDWTIRKVWLATRTEFTAERVEENQRFVKLSFPATATAQWNSTRYLAPFQTLTVRGETLEKVYDDWRSEYSNLSQPYSINNRTFDSTLTVVHANLEELTNRRYYKEVYARNIGLVYRRLEILSSQCKVSTTGTCPNANKDWYGFAEKGFVLTMRLRSFN